MTETTSLSLVCETRQVFQVNQCQFSLSIVQSDKR